MARAFRRRRGQPGLVEVELDADERGLLASLLAEVAGMLDDGTDTTGRDPLAELVGFDAGPGPGGPPAYPAVARLLPDAHRDDPELAAEFRRLTEHGLRNRKRAALRTAVEALSRDGEGRPLLTRPEAQALLKGLTDVRLVLAERLGVHSDEDATRLHHAVLRLAGADRDPWAAHALLYDVLTWWQESLVEALQD